MPILQLPSRRGHVPSGGTTGQVVTKLSNDQWDYNWANPTGGGGGGGAWGTITGILSDQTDLQTALNNKIDTSAAPSGAIVGTTDTQSLTNKRLSSRVTSITSSATPSINTDTCDVVTVTALAVDITSMTTNLTGTPNNFDKLIIRFKDNGTPRAITWGASFTASQSPLPLTTVASKVTTVGLIWDAVKSKWVCLALDQEP